MWGEFILANTILIFNIHLFPHCKTEPKANYVGNIYFCTILL